MPDVSLGGSNQQPFDSQPNALTSWATETTIVSFLKGRFRDSEINLQGIKLSLNFILNLLKLQSPLSPDKLVFSLQETFKYRMSRHKQFPCFGVEYNVFYNLKSVGSSYYIKLDTGFEITELYLYLNPYFKNHKSLNMSHINHHLKYTNHKCLTAFSLFETLFS